MLRVENSTQRKCYVHKLILQLHLWLLVPAVIFHVDKQSGKELLLVKIVGLFRELLLLGHALLQGGNINLLINGDLVIVLLLHVL